MTIFKWVEISEAPRKPGVYAWYYVPEITNFDIDDAIKELIKKKEKNDHVGARKMLSQFLDKFLFKYFAEDPYNVALRGPLKPKYEGTLKHIPSVSESLLDRIVEDPHRLRTMQKILKESAPNFASPIYIGMSENLHVRLLRHKNLIERFFSGKLTENATEYKDRDQGFAWQIYCRNINPPDLFVTLKVIEDGQNNYIDIENILNRIHFPIFGRN